MVTKKIASGLKRNVVPDRIDLRGAVKGWYKHGICYLDSRGTSLHIGHVKRMA